MKMTEQIRKRAYLLWERDGCPTTDGLHYWLKAERQLQHRQRKIRCGELNVTGKGSVDDLVDLALLVADSRKLKLSDNIIIEDEDGIEDIIQTQERLKLN